MENNFCSHCGAPLKENTRFCATCGAPVNNSYQDYPHSSLSPNFTTQNSNLMSWIALISAIFGFVNIVGSIIGLIISISILKENPIDKRALLARNLSLIVVAINAIVLVLFLLYFIVFFFKYIFW